jgi:hypothetical protein
LGVYAVCGVFVKEPYARAWDTVFVIVQGVIGRGREAFPVQHVKAQGAVKDLQVILAFKNLPLLL